MLSRTDSGSDCVSRISNVGNTKLLHGTVVFVGVSVIVGVMVAVGIFVGVSVYVEVTSTGIVTVASEKSSSHICTAL